MPAPRGPAWYKDARLWVALGVTTIVIIILAIVVSSGDGEGAPAQTIEQPVAPSLLVLEPTSGDIFEVGQEVSVRAKAQHDSGIRSLDLNVNGVLVDSNEPPGEPPRTFEGVLHWTPDEPGRYILSVVALVLGESLEQTLEVNVTLPAGAAAEVEATEPTNVRERPSTASGVQIYAQLQPGERRLILGKLPDENCGNWFLIDFPPSPTGEGWVCGRVVTVRGDVEAVAVVTPPPEPTVTATPTPTPTPTPEGGPDIVPVAVTPTRALVANSGEASLQNVNIQVIVHAGIENNPCGGEVLAAGQVTVADLPPGTSIAVPLQATVPLTVGQQLCVSITLDPPVGQSPADTLNDNAILPVQPDA